jgi:hypothetical protein
MEKNFVKIAFITSLFGKRGNNPARFQRIDGYDYFLFSDRDQKDFDTDWDVYNISHNPNISNLNCNVRKSRYAKFMGWELLDSMSVDYDCIYYCDVHWNPKCNVDWASISNTFISQPYPFLQLIHNFSCNHGIAHECQHIINCHRDSKDNIVKTLLFFKKKFPEISLSAKQYFENTMFGYAPNDLVQQVARDFWKIYTEPDITFRDQPTWNLMLLKHDLKPQTEPNLRDKFENKGSYGNHNYA